MIGEIQVDFSAGEGATITDAAGEVHYIPDVASFEISSEPGMVPRLMAVQFRRMMAPGEVAAVLRSLSRLLGLDVRVHAWKVEP